MILFIICVLTIIALGVYVTVKTKPVKNPEPTIITTTEEVMRDPAPLNETNPVVSDPQKTQSPMTNTTENKKAVKDQPKPKRKYTKKTK